MVDAESLITIRLRWNGWTIVDYMQLVPLCNPSLCAEERIDDPHHVKSVNAGPHVFRAAGK